MFGRILDAAERFVSQSLFLGIKRFPVTFLISLLIIPVALTVYDSDAYFNLIIYLSALFVSVPAHLVCERKQTSKKQNVLFTILSCAVTVLLFTLSLKLYLFDDVFSDLVFSLLLPVCTLLSYLALRGPHFDFRLILSLCCRFLCSLLFSFALSSLHGFLLRNSYAFFGQPSMFMSWGVSGFILVTIPVNLFLSGIPECFAGKSNKQKHPAK